MLQDIQYAIRMLLKSPGFTAVALLILALGIAADISIFSIINAVLLRPLPYQNPSQIVTVSNSFRQIGFEEVPVSVPEFMDYREQGQVFQHVAAFVPLSANLTGVDQPARISAMEVSANYFSVLGIEPALGRTFLPEDEQPGITEIAVISYGLWQRRFGGYMDAIGKTLKLDYDNYTIVGVMPRGFQHPGDQLTDPIELWFPAGFKADPFPPPLREDRRLSIIALLKPDVAIDQAQAEMNTLASQLQREYPDQYQRDSGWNITISPLQEKVVGDIRPALLMLFGAVLFVLLIACTNLANLLLARGTGRQKEIAIRIALGATRGRLIRQLLIESVVLSFLGGVLGCVLTFWSVRGLVSLASEEVPRVTEASIDYNVLGFALMISIVTGIGFGLVPAFQVSKTDLNGTLKEGRKGTSASSGNNRVRSLLVVSEIALTLVLLIGAGLLIRSFWEMQRVDPGFDPQNVVTVGIWLPYPNQPESGKYFRDAQRSAFYTQLLQRVEELPGVQSAGLISRLPLNIQKSDRVFFIEGQENRSAEDVAHGEVRVVSPNYFPTMGIRLLSGRIFTQQDDAKAPGVAIINRTMSRRFWPNEEPIGKRLKLGQLESDEPWLSVIGVVNDVKTLGLDAETPPEVYSHYLQSAPLSMTLVARTASHPTSQAFTIQDQVRAVDIDQPVYNIKTMEEVVSLATGQRRLSLLLLCIFAVAALVLAAIGIYGVISYSVSQRTQEIGIRMALGAQQKDIIKLVLGQAMMILAVGVAVGLVVALYLTRLMSSLLWGISALDATTFVVAPLILISVALVASYLPSLKAIKVDPAIALRNE
jgi:putative ABC transport system permease protein